MAISSSHPADAPPPYEEAVGSSSAPKPLRRVSTDGPTSRTARNGIPPEHRRSMEDENRELPPGWVRQFDLGEQHQFFVDTNANPPRSIWTHPYDDPDFLATLSPEERKKHSRMHRSVTLEDITAESSDEEDHHHTAKLPPRPNAAGGAASSSQPASSIHRFTRKMKDKLTDSTHEQRQRQRIQREEAERKAYQAHMQARQAMARAMQTGQPQFLCKDQHGRDVYIEPPGFGGRAYGGYGQQGYGYNPYSQGPYANPNVRFVRPSGPYGRPYGFGYGGGIGAPVAAGLLGGALLGGVLF
ncbi:hypothetical protein DPSP01_009009 [Paraphaeosphaeria sporulosa]|uniref:WW domain-containing protein n=1 Tax=Paraphaeosphaeria sporulosa TaxID=1460663 RepID=A0A177C9G8_9PLEO|nr:uncharacterized protein CC84DRAFT_1165657 [Paraphaeosphaeria sporulosa]OAG03418.1 hypothetical protein CC84DRAFT_1165657 [Paraphaeosphaeria sporulosa]